MEESNLVLVDKNNLEHVYQIISTINNGKKELIIYTSGEKNKDGFNILYAGRISNNKIYPIKDDSDWELIEKLMNKLKEE